MNSLKNGEGVPLLNFEAGPGVPLLNFEGVSGSRSPRSQGPGPTFTPCLCVICKVIISFNPLVVDDL